MRCKGDEKKTTRLYAKMKIYYSCDIYAFGKQTDGEQREIMRRTWNWRGRYTRTFV